MADQMKVSLKKCVLHAALQATVLYTNDLLEFRTCFWGERRMTDEPPLAPPAIATPIQTALNLNLNFSHS